MTASVWAWAAYALVAALSMAVGFYILHRLEQWNADGEHLLEEQNGALVDGWWE